MIIWLALVIPLIAIPILFWRFQHQIRWWELLILAGTPILLITIAKFTIEYAQVADAEFWGGWATKAEYYEDWDEEVSCRHPRYTTDSKGNSHFAGYYHLYDVDYHPPYWQIVDSNGLVVYICQGNYRRLTGQFNNENFVDLHRRYHSNDGDKYVTTWPGSRETLEPVVTQHTYINKVQASSSIFNFPKIDPKKVQLFEYPGIDGDAHQACILGDVGPQVVQAEKYLQYWNAILGTTKQAKIFVLLFKNKQMRAAMDQEAYWKRGNKNELIVCIGIDDQYNTQWSYVFSWTEVEILKVEVKNLALDQKVLDLPTLVERVGPLVQEKWIRKHFRDFDYLSIDPPTWAVVLVFVLTLAVSTGLSIWVVKNDV